MIAMATKKAKLDAAARKAAQTIQDHLVTLPLAEVKAMLKDLQKLAVKSSRSARPS